MPGVHLVISPQGFGYGVGQWAFGPDALDRLRQAFCDPDRRAQFLALVARGVALGEALGPSDLARMPKGWQADGDWEHLLRRKPSCCGRGTMQITPIGCSAPIACRGWWHWRANSRRWCAGCRR